MKFSIANRKLMQTLFDMGTVDAIGGTFESSGTEKHWNVYYHRATDPFCRSQEYYSAYISGDGDDLRHLLNRVEGTLDEVLNALEDKMAELAA